MAEFEAPREEAEEAAKVLGPETGLVEEADPMLLEKAAQEMWAGIVRNPVEALFATTRFMTAATAAGAAAVTRALGGSATPVVEASPRDRRFADPTWSQNPVFWGALQGYLLWSRLMAELVEVADLDETMRRKAELVTQMMIDALAPTNFFWGNPTAIRRAFETGGESVRKGWENWLDDLVHNQGWPRQVDASGFKVGENVAATPGKVIFRNELMELMQYAPQTETVFETPILFSPPWINKYYIMDLAPGRSFVEWAVKQGHTVFAISYRNPDESMSGVTLDDYLIYGPRAALDVIEEITGHHEVNIVGLCLGGSLTTMLLAHLAALDKRKVRSATLLNTLIDFSEPGALGAFVDPESIRRLEAKMAKRGYLESKEMRTTFDILRVNDLIWNYVVSNWLLGESPPAFDILAWNNDSTRMPAAMHSFYLRNCYLENRLAKGEMELAGTPLRLSEITEDVYLLAAIEDHIAPWTSSYKATLLLKGNVRFVLSSAGHIAGIVNPPSPKAKYWVNDDELPAEPQAWLSGATERPGSWWDDWAAWAADHGGERRSPPPMGSDTHPALYDAPGKYVLREEAA